MKSAAADKNPQRRLKIAVLNRVFSGTGGGAERYSMAIVEKLAARHDIHVFAQEINHQWPGVTYHHVTCFFKKPRWLNQLWYAFATWQGTRNGFDIVHSHENVWHGNVQTMHVKTVKGSVLGVRTGWALVLRCIKISWSPRLMTYLAFERSRMKKSSRRSIVAASDALREELVAQYPNALQILKVVTPGVDIPTQVATKKEALCALEIRASGRFVLFVANDFARKGLATLLKAMSLLPEDVHLLVVGGSGQSTEFSAQAQALGVAARTHFLGPLKNMGTAYQAADMLVHPTLEDTFGMVVLEAMAYSVPVVVSSKQYCGASALLTNEVHALILQEPQNVQQLCLAMLKILNEPELAGRLTAQGLLLAREHSWQAAAQAYEAIFQRLVKPPA